MQLRLSRQPCFIDASGRAHALMQRDAEILTWLAIEGPTTRARLAQLLWPESTTDAARNVLRQRLFLLKKQLGVALVDGTATLSLADGITHDLGDAGEVLAELGDAGGEFGTWLAGERDKRRARHRRSIVECADDAERHHDYATALALAQELLADEPVSEAAHRRLMRVHYLRGDRAAALLAFDRCEQVLKDEVGARPSAETLALLASIEQTSTRAAPVAGAAVPASVLRPPRMVGRDREFTLLAQGWDAGQVVAVIGEAGQGKSRLLQEFTAERCGLVHVAARPGDAGVPLATLSRLLRAVLARAVQAPVLDGSTRTEIARVLPEFDASAPRHPGEGQRLVLQRAVRALLQAHALDGGEPLAGLLVDDLHFADEASLDMLRGLIDDENEQGLALRWALAYRPTEAASPLQTLHDALIEQARLRPLPLQPLDEAGLAELVDSLGLPGVDGAALAPSLLKRTGGNPLFVLETLKQAWVENTLAQLADRAQLPRPVSVGRLIERRIAQLSPGALALARVASIAGVDFSIGMAEHVLGVSAMQFADAINELEAAQVLRGNAFAHDLVFEAVAGSVPAAIAEHTHARVAAWLEEQDGEPARIALHWIDGGKPQRALPWLDRASDAAKRALRVKEYIAFLDRKSAIEEDAGDAQQAFDSLYPAVDDAISVGVDGETGLAYCDRLDRLARTPRQFGQAALMRAGLFAQRGEGEQALAVAQQGVALCDTVDDESLRMRAAKMLGTAYAVANRFKDAAHCIEDCIAWFDAYAGDTERADAHVSLALAYDNIGRLDDAVPHHRIACELTHRAGDLQNASVAYCNAGRNRSFAGDLEAAEHDMFLAEQLLGAYEGFGAHLGTVRLARAMLLAQLGRLREALDETNEALVWIQTYQPGHVPLARIRLAACWWQLGQWARLSKELDQITIGPQATQVVRVGHARLRWVYARATGADPQLQSQARDAMARVLQEIPPGERHDLRLPLELELADEADPQNALRQIDAAREHARRMGYRNIELAARLRAAAVAVACDPARARREALEALTLHQQGWRTTAVLPGEAWLRIAGALEAAGDRAHAGEIAAEGRDWVQRIARTEVPEPFRDSYLHQNPINRDLLALAARIAPR